ncbi:DEAD/DEAH box helicase family protein [Mesonia sp.]|uniref:DEAD/DEAH box helicase family protein n=1 Tax=Mesonia sp. TaxID=1960830 RepID=UPI003F967AE8
MAAFHNKIVLGKYLLSQFQVYGFESLAVDLKASRLEGYTEEGNTKYLAALLNRLFDNDKLSKEMLQEYDENIVRHTNEISHHRVEQIKWKYFQYLSLVFTEIYLEKYFSNPINLLAELNQFVTRFNDPFDEDYKKLNPDDFTVEPFIQNDLNKIALWNATGSGKTLLMHIHIKQYLHYAKKYNQHNHNKVLLITPNEGLSIQHLEEFRLSNIDAGMFSKEMSGMFSGAEVEVLEITKLAEASGDKTVAVDAFETNNLVLIDEGHRGASGDKWKMFRDQLSETGFAFEYSATFGQAISAAAGKSKKELEQEYSKSIIFDYSYKFFYNDGYGKEYKILNLNDDSNAVFVRKYLTANLLSFYQQTLIYSENKKLSEAFLLEKPLWVFVGGSVNAVRKVGGKETSDVLQIITFLTYFIKNKSQAVNDIADIINDGAGLNDERGNSIFYNSFNYLNEAEQSADAIYTDICKRVFNSEVLGANLYLDNLKGADGELGLRVGESEYFGVINVGDEAKLHKLAMENEVLGTDLEFSSSLFQNINEKDSQINLLIGSKKFTEGWSSWRVSSMGLMNIGRSEGSQIIQLFGRGVRLKGHNFSLKRSSGLDEYQRPENLREKRKLLLPMETLGIFGVRADYMQKFKEFLEEEGLPANDSSWITVTVPTKTNGDFLKHNLKVLQVKEGENFKEKINLDLILSSLIFDNSKIDLDWYPKIQVLSTASHGALAIANKNQGYLSELHLAFLDWNKVFFEIQRFKFEKHWYNLSLNQETLKDIIYSRSWYNLFIPSAELEMRSFSQTLIWEELAIALLKKYVEKFYTYHKNLFNSEHIETRVLGGSDENLVYEYEVKLNTEKSLETVQTNLDRLLEKIAGGNMEDSYQLGSQFVAFNNEQHLYNPLLYISADAYKNAVSIAPVPLDESEKLFMDDLLAYYRNHRSQFESKKLFLLRNQSKKGIGFFVDTNNFYPDFILWLVDGDKQHIAFIDPKGIRNSKGLSDAKIQFHKLIKDKIQPQVAAENVELSSFIISNTKYFELNWKADTNIDEFHNNNVYFQYEDKETYIGEMLRKI